MGFERRKERDMVGDDGRKEGEPQLPDAKSLSRGHEKRRGAEGDGGGAGALGVRRKEVQAGDRENVGGGWLARTGAAGRQQSGEDRGAHDAAAGQPRVADRVARCLIVTVALRCGDGCMRCGSSSAYSALLRFETLIILDVGCSDLIEPLSKLRAAAMAH